MRHRERKTVGQRASACELEALPLDVLNAYPAHKQLEAYLDIRDPKLELAGFPEDQSVDCVDLSVLCERLARDRPLELRLPRARTWITC